jgi:hypothetical protein
MGSFSEDSSEKNKLIIGIWEGVYLTTPSLLPPTISACYAGYVFAKVLAFLNFKNINIMFLFKYM